MLGNENDHQFSLSVSSGQSSGPSIEMYNKPQGLYVCAVCSIDILNDITEQHISVEYLINKCYPCIVYGMASHYLSVFRNLTTAGE